MRKPLKLGAPGWLRQLIVPAFDFSLGHDLTVPGFEPRIELCVDSMKPAWDSLSPPLSMSPSPALSLYLSLKNKQINIKKGNL